MPEAAASYPMIYRVMDGDANTAAGDADELRFTITVQPPPEGDFVAVYDAAAGGDQVFAVAMAALPAGRFSFALDLRGVADDVEVYLISTNPTADPLAAPQIATVRRRGAGRGGTQPGGDGAFGGGARRLPGPAPPSRDHRAQQQSAGAAWRRLGVAGDSRFASSAPVGWRQACLLGDRLRVGGGRAHSRRGAGGGHRPLAAGYVRGVGGRRELGYALRAGPLRHPAHGRRAGRRVPARTGGALGYRTLCSAPGQVASRWPKT